MKQKDVFKKIGEIIEELSDQYEYLKTVDELNELELELFVSNAHFLTDHIEILCKLNLQNSKVKRPPVEKPETTYQQKYFEPVVQQMKHSAGITEEEPARPPFKSFEPEPAKIDSETEQPIPAKDDQPEAFVSLEPIAVPEPEIIKEPELIRHELVLDEAEILYEDENTGIENDAPAEVKKTKDTLNTGNEALNGSADTAKAKTSEDVRESETTVVVAAAEVITINQKILSQLGDKAISKTEQLSIKPISDIKLAITLNDKLLYVKDLFNGYNLAYSEAIEILNRFNTFEEAMRFLKTNYVTKNNWESKPATTEKFYALLKRRYA